ncbi:hypothetical protein R3W88_014535 [Solanum pinnatisectum]|uniref:RNase H type-1 domain-containing protein n=1 Tax=Solanum pinnatisectum TaxID=50273 RepID=A0AAV9KS20_9SOLN|nr:hypothetical protein R3W88_014535 [Solanum pinnatisectum]
MKDQNKAGTGRIVRNRNRDLVMAFAYPAQFYTNNISEAFAALIRISWCYEENIRNIEMELDLMIVINISKGVTRPSWRLQIIIDDI